MGKMKGASLEQSVGKPSGEPDYETEDAMRTMHSAAAIAANPAKLKKVHKLAGRRHAALTGMIEPILKKPKKFKSLDDLKAYAGKDKSKPEPDDDGDMD